MDSLVESPDNLEISFKKVNSGINSYVGKFLHFGIASQEDQ